MVDREMGHGVFVVLAQMAWDEAQVNLRRVELAMTQELLDVAHVSTAAQQVDRYAVAEEMGMHPDAKDAGDVAQQLSEYLTRQATPTPRTQEERPRVWATNKIPTERQIRRRGM